MRTKTFLICLAILTLRGWDRLTHAGLWAEDGAIFLGDSLTKGWGGTFQPYEGYFHTGNRLAMQFFTQLPLSYLPTLIVVACFIFYAWVMSMFADSSYRHLVKSDFNRACLAIGLCILPGTHEVIGSLCNTHRIWAAYFFLLGLRDPKDNLKLSHLFMTFFVAGSAGESIAFLPLFLYRTYQRFKNNPRVQFISRELILMTILLGWTVLIIQARTTSTTNHLVSMGELLHATLAAFVFNFSLQPIFGWRFSGNLFNHALPLFTFLAAGFSFVLLRDAWKNRNNSRIMIYLAAVCMCGIQELSWFVRPIDISMFKDFFPSLWWSETRFAYSLAFAAFLVWGIVCANHSKKLGIAFIALYFILSGPLKIKRVGDVSGWSATAAILEKSVKTGCPKDVHLEFFPEGWHLDYHSEKNQNCI